jgi:serine/threonine-protein kinase
MPAAVDPHLEQYALEVEMDRNHWFTLYQGYRRQDNTPVVVRLATPLLTGDEFLAHRFRHLTKQAAQLEHPNIIRIYEVEQENDFLYTVQDFVQAPSLAAVIAAEGPFSLERTQFIAGQIASALDYAHQKPLPHGDLSARQIYLGPKDRVFINNFGQSQAVLGAKLMASDFSYVSAETIAPERVDGQGPSRPADLYALGVLCYQMLAKKPPFTGPVSTVLHAHAHKQPPPLRQVNPAVPLAVGEVIERMLSKSVELRYNTGAEFVRALAMASRLQGSTRQYDYLIPLKERERPKPATVGTALRFFAAVVVSLLITTLSAWAGYELGLKQQAAYTPNMSSPDLIVNSTVPTPTKTPETQLVSSVIFTPGAGLATPILRQGIFSDTVLLKQSLLSDTLLAVTPTLTPSLVSSPPKATSTPVPPAAPPVLAPAGQGVFRFHNPTGHDLIVDLTGPTNASTLVPPGQQHEFFVEPGSYQYMVHTPTGRWLEPVVAYFNLVPGQLIQKDYYSDHDWTKN